MRDHAKGLRCLLVLNLLFGGGFVFAPKAEALQSLLFPFVTTETGKFTFITINNDDFSAGLPISLHFTYGIKAVPIVNKAGCEHFDGNVTTTPFDMMIFEVNRKVIDASGTTALFEGGNTAPVTSTPLALPTADRVGFLIVEQNAASLSFLFGTATVIDSATGLTFSYSTNYLTTATGAGLNPSFAAIDGGDFDFGTVTNTGFKSISWYPVSIVTTSWFVLPLSDRATMSSGEGFRLALMPRIEATGLGGAFDLDEAFFSGSKTAPVQCFGLITRGDLLQPATAAATDGGGFTAVVSTTLTLSAADSVDPGGVYGPGSFSMFKVQATSALGSPRSTVHQEPDVYPCFRQKSTTPAGFDSAC